MIDRGELLAHPPWQTMQHVGHAHAVETIETGWNAGKQIGLANARAKLRKPARGAIETILVDVEQDEALELGPSRASEKEPGADARLEMIGRKIGAVQFEQSP